MCCSGLELSLNEVESLAAKAARGAGLAWGLAEQIGRSARWLARQGVDWAGSLTPLLAADPAVGSPFLAGAYLADLAGAADPIGPVRGPLWAVPPLAALAVGRVACVRLDACEIRIGAQVGATLDAAALLALPAAMVSLRLVDDAPPLRPWPAPLARVRVAAAALAPLQRLAARTYVPGDARSRARGAGATREDD